MRGELLLGSVIASAELAVRSVGISPTVNLQPIHRLLFFFYRLFIVTPVPGYISCGERIDSGYLGTILAFAIVDLLLMYHEQKFGEKVTLANLAPRWLRGRGDDGSVRASAAHSVKGNEPVHLQTFHGRDALLILKKLLVPFHVFVVKGLRVDEIANVAFGKVFGGVVHPFHVVVVAQFVAEERLFAKGAFEKLVILRVMFSE